MGPIALNPMKDFALIGVSIMRKREFSGAVAVALC